MMGFIYIPEKKGFEFLIVPNVNKLQFKKLQFTIYKLQITVSDITPWFIKTWIYSYASDFCWRRTQTHNTLVCNHPKEYVLTALVQLQLMAKWFSFSLYSQILKNFHFLRELMNKKIFDKKKSCANFFR